MFESKDHWQMQMARGALDLTFASRARGRVVANVKSAPLALIDRVAGGPDKIARPNSFKNIRARGEADHGGYVSYGCGAARSLAAVTAHALAGDAGFARRLVRILRSV